GCAAASQRRAHVGLDLGRRQGTVVYTYLVNCPREVLSIDAVAAYLQLVRRRGDGACPRLGRYLRPVHVEAECRAVVRQRDVGPHSTSQRARASDVRTSAAEGAASVRGASAR